MSSSASPFAPPHPPTGCATRRIAATLLASLFAIELRFGHSSHWLEFEITMPGQIILTPRFGGLPYGQSFVADDSSRVGAARGCPSRAAAIPPALRRPDCVCRQRQCVVG